MSRFTTSRDAQTYVDNSGPGMWEAEGWGGTSSAAGWVRWIWRNVEIVDEMIAGEEEDEYVSRDELFFQIALASYLHSAGEDLDDYDLGQWLSDARDITGC